MARHRTVDGWANMPWDQAEERWRDRRGSFVLPTNRFDPTGWEVVALVGEGSDNVARSFVRTHHYSAKYVAARYRFGLFNPRGELCGVAVFSQPSNNRSLTKHLPGLRSHLEGVDLGRFVLLDEVGHGGESWTLARCFEQLANWEAPPLKWDKATGGSEPWLGVRGVVSFSDPVPRRNVHGKLTLVGHWGTIYQATNGRYVGRASKSTLSLLPDGGVIAPRSISKVRTGERSSAGVVRDLIAAGACEPQSGENMRSWAEAALASVEIMRFRHPGNHKYVWALPGARGDRTSKRLAKLVRRNLETVPALARPKVIDAEPTPMKTKAGS
jgi:hypothetical protein